MKEEQIEFQNNVLGWFSSLRLVDCQKGASLLSKLLKKIKGVKNAPNICSFRPCQRHCYARGICAKHYATVNKLRKLTQCKWDDLVAIGFCRWSFHQEKKFTRPFENDPLRILFKPLALNKKEK